MTSQHLATDLARAVRASAVRLRTRRRVGQQSAALQRDLAGWSGPVKLHLGAGSISLPGWVNTDYDGSADYFLDARKPWPVPPVDYVYADNVLEHFTLQELREVLTAAFSAMRPGGALRVCVPDVERNARLYLDGGPDADLVLARHVSHGYPADYRQELLRVVFSLNDHATGYQHDLASLTAELERAGFSDVRRVQVGQSVHPELRDLEARTTPAEDLMLLTVDATR